MKQLPANIWSRTHRLVLPVLEMVSPIFVLLGVLAVVALKALGVLDSFWTRASFWGGSVITLVGPTIWLLVPLNVLLAGITLQHVAGRKLSPRHLAILAKIEWVAPLFGFLGTCLGLSQGMGALDLSNGIQQNVTMLTVKVGQALWSTVYGLIVSIGAGLQLPMIAGEAEGGTDR